MSIFNRFLNRGTYDKKKTVLFLHIPKCAGTTLTEEIIKKRFGSEQLIVFYDYGTEVLIARLKKMPTHQKEQIRCIAGHFAFGVHQLLPQPVTYITMLRKPVDRVISHFYFAKNNKDHYLHDIIHSNDLALKDYVERLENIEMDNGQTRILAGIGWGAKFGECDENILDKAIKNLERHFSVVGVSERFNDFLQLINYQLRWNVAGYKNQNVSRNRLKTEDIDKETLDTIIKHNRLDIALYRYASLLFENQLSKIQ